MLVATQGIVLKTINYSETSVIAKIYTRKLGIRSYIINGVRSVKGRQKAAMLQVLNHLELIVYERNNKDLHRTQEIKYAQIYTAIPFDVVRTAIALFYAEILYKTLKEETANTPFFDFIIQEIQLLENATKTQLANLPIKFMLELSQFLGFYPANNFGTQFPQFNITEGLFEQTQTPSDTIIDQALSQLLAQLLQTPFEQWQAILKTRQQRQEIINLLQKYYLWHVEQFTELRSLKVLTNIF